MTAAAKVFPAWGAVISAMARVGVAKDRENKAQGFRFRGVDDVMTALSAALAEHRLAMSAHYHDRELIERVAKSGGATYNVVLRGDYRLYSTEDGSSVEVGTFVGEANDSADKATNKAMSAAWKYAAFQTFCIPLEGTPDADQEAPETLPSLPTPPPSDPVFDRTCEMLQTAQTHADIDAASRYWRANRKNHTHQQQERLGMLADHATRRATAPQREPGDDGPDEGGAP